MTQRARRYQQPKPLLIPLLWQLIVLTSIAPSVAGAVDSREWIAYSAGHKGIGNAPGGVKQVELYMGLCDGAGSQPVQGYTYSRIVTDPTLDYSALTNAININAPMWGLASMAKRFPITGGMDTVRPTVRCDTLNPTPHVIFYVDVKAWGRSESSWGYGTGGIGPTTGQCIVNADNTTITVVPSPRGHVRAVPARVDITCSYATSATLSYAPGPSPYIPVGDDKYLLRVNGAVLPQSYNLVAGVTSLDLTVLPLQNTNRPGTYEGHTVITVTYQ